jgi:hypothetical protein
VSFLKQLKLNTMKKAKLTLIVFAMALLAVACKKEDNSPKPVAGFNITSNDTLNIDQERFNSPIHLNRCNMLYVGILEMALLQLQRLMQQRTYEFGLRSY